MVSLSIFFLGLLVVTYAAPINLDDAASMVDENGSFKLHSGTEKRFTENVVDREEERSLKLIVPFDFHSYNDNGDVLDDIPFTGTADNRIPPWKRGDKDPVPHPIPASKHNLVDADENTRATGADPHLPTPPPMPEHKLLQLNTELMNAGFLPQFNKGSYSLNFPYDVVQNRAVQEAGFQATGDHLPTPPPMPEHKLKYEVNESSTDADYFFSFESADGTKISESGSQKRQVGPKPEDIGSTVYRAYYNSHGNGLHATSDDLSPPSSAAA